ncbi:MAG: EAL domain-containing protein [Polyangiales bacterium]
MKSHGFETEIEVAAAIDAGHLSLSLEPEIVLATRRCESVRVRPWLTLPGIGPIDARLFASSIGRQGRTAVFAYALLERSLAEVTRLAVRGAFVRAVVEVDPELVATRGFACVVKDELADTGLPPSAITLEIDVPWSASTTRTVGENLEALVGSGIAARLPRVKDLDSLCTRLDELPFTELSVHRGLVNHLLADARSERREVLARLRRCRPDLRIVAEGGSHLAEAEALSACGFTVVRDDGFGPGLGTAALVRLLRRESSPGRRTRDVGSSVREIA